MNKNTWLDEQDDKYPDHSKCLWHLTRDKQKFEKGFPDGFNAPEKAKERFYGIIAEKRIRASKLLHVDPDFHNLDKHPIAACFTECIPSSMPIHASRYSLWGFLFEKKYIFGKGGRPALYVDLALFNRLTKDKIQQPVHQHINDFPEDHIHLFTPFVPGYSHETMQGGIKKYNFSVEREWRIGKDLQFEYREIYALLVPEEQDWLELIKTYSVLSGSKHIALAATNFQGISKWDDIV